MAKISEFVNVQNILKTSVAPQAGFGLQLFLVDDDQIPVDVRYILVTADSYSDSFESTSIPYKYCQAYFGQAIVPDQLMVGRWISAATAPFWYAGPAYETTIATLEDITDGEFLVTNSNADETEVTGIDFSGITTFAQFLSKINLALAALVTPDVTGLNTATFAIDATGRVALTMVATGSAVPTFTISEVSGGSGTDLAKVLDSDNGVAVSGYDAESLVESKAEIADINDTFYNIHQRGGSAAQVEELAIQIETEKKLLDVVISDPNAKNPALDTDLGSTLQALSLNRTLCIYSEKTDEYPDAAVAGRVFPLAEGSSNFAYQKLALVTESGDANPLTAGQKIALSDKGYNRIETVGNITFMYDGLCCSGEEKRIMLGSDWLVARIAEGIFTIQINKDIMAFDNDSISQVESVVRDWATEAIARKIVVDTPDRPATFNFPDADDITAAMRATHRLTVQSPPGPAWVLYVNSAINDYTIIGEWRI
jgi:hypothetical protein